MTDAAAAPAAMPARTMRGTIGLIAALVAVLAIPLSALGRLAGLWGPLPIMLVAFLLTFFGLLIAIVTGLIGVLRKRDVRRSWIALVLGIVVAIPVAQFLAVGLQYPPIHDISTDTDNPPQFVALLLERSATHAPNTAEYNPKVAAAQHKGFPDLKPTDMAAPADQAFQKALAAAKEMKWRIAAAEPSEGRIEAVDTTFWSGFIDDVVIRVAAVDDGHSRIDVRSLSRAGGGDAGKNGMRIREYLTHLK